MAIDSTHNRIGQTGIGGLQSAFQYYLRKKRLHELNRISSFCKTDKFYSDSILSLCGNDLEGRSDAAPKLKDLSGTASFDRPR